MAGILSFMNRPAYISPNREGVALNRSFHMDSAQMPKSPHTATLFQQSSAFLSDFCRFAGRRGIRAGILVALGAFFEGIGIVLLIPILSVVVNSGNTNRLTAQITRELFSLLHIQSHPQQLLLLLGVFVILMTLRMVVISARDIALNELQLGFVQALRCSVTRRLASARWDAVIRLRHARIAHLMGSDIQNIGLATHLMIQCAMALVLILTQVLLAIFLSPALSILVLMFLATGLFALAPVMRRARRLGHFVADTNLALMNNTIQFLGGLKLAISQNLQHSFVAEYEDMLAGMTRQHLENLRQWTKTRTVLAALSALAAAAIIFVGFSVLNIAPAILITLTLILVRMSAPVMLLQQNAQTFAQTLPAYEKVQELELDLGAMDTALMMVQDSAVPSGPIVLRNVSFRYTKETGEDAGLRDINLTLQPGTIIGLTGPSGAGKTTLADLIVGLFSPLGGEISVGGTVLRGGFIPAWQRSISYVSQDPFLFYDTIRRNLLWAAPDAGEEDLRMALALTGATDLLSHLDLGMDTVVGERGVRMSGGERQRLALARALLRNPHLLVLDEATNAIDIAGEHEILRRIAQLEPRPTILIITHRTESLIFCDRVLVLENGTVVSDSSDAVRLDASV